MAGNATDSGIFRIQPARYAAAGVRRLVLRCAWPAAAVYAVLAWAGLRGDGDVRFAIVALIVTFMVYPLLLAFAWFSMLSSPEVLKACLPQSWRESDSGDGFDITYYNYDATDVSGEEHISADSIADVVRCGAYTCVSIAGGRRLLAPADKLPDGLHRILAEAADGPLA